MTPEEYENACERIDKVLDDLWAKHPDKVEQAKRNSNLAGWFIGRAMKALGGTSPDAANMVTTSVMVRLQD